MRFLIDMGLGVRIAEWLRLQGHDAVHLHEEGLDRLPDGRIFAKAAAEARIILTCDLGFGEIVARSAGSEISVVVFRMASVGAVRIIPRLSLLLDLHASALDQGAVVVVEESRIRIRGLPFGN